MAQESEEITAEKVGDTVVVAPKAAEAAQAKMRPVKVEEIYAYAKPGHTICNGRGYVHFDEHNVTVRDPKLHRNVPKTIPAHDDWCSCAWKRFIRENEVVAIEGKLFYTVAGLKKADAEVAEKEKATLAGPEAEIERRTKQIARLEAERAEIDLEAEVYRKEIAALNAVDDAEQDKAIALMTKSAEAVTSLEIELNDPITKARTARGHATEKKTTLDARIAAIRARCEVLVEEERQITQHYVEQEEAVAKSEIEKSDALGLRIKEEREQLNAANAAFDALDGARKERARHPFRRLAPLRHRLDAIDKKLDKARERLAEEKKRA